MKKFYPRRLFRPKTNKDDEQEYKTPPRHDSANSKCEEYELTELPSNPGGKESFQLAELRRKLSKFETTSRRVPSPTPSLLGLPTKIRAKILTVALPTNTDIHILPAGTLYEARPREPSILQTCRRLRTEASQIYYQSNNFYVYIKNFNATALITWIKDFPRECPKLSMAPIKLIVSEPEGRVCWENLVEWLRSYYRSEVLGLAVTDAAFANEGPAKVQAARTLFREVDRLRDLGAQVQPEWKDVEGALEDVRKGEEALQ